MIALSWNCRGLGHPRAIPVLRELVRTHKPDIFILIETLVHSNKLEEIRVQFGFDFVFGVDRVGRSGGLGVLWKANLNCVITCFSRNHLDMEIDDVHRGKWRLTGIYGFPERDKRRASWDFLRTLHTRSNLPWVSMGDFNDLLHNEGRLDHPAWCIRGFQEAVTDCALHDLPMNGYPFTWVKSKGTKNMVEEKLDRALVSTSWRAIWLSNVGQRETCKISLKNTQRMQKVSMIGYSRSYDLKKKVNLAKFAAVLWGIWRQRNNKLWNDTILDCRQTIFCALDFVYNWLDIKKKRRGEKESNVDGKSSTIWKKPQPNFIKCNVDAAFFTETRSMGFGMVIRDHEGKIIGCRSMIFDGLCSVKEGEAMSLREALSWIREMQFNRVKFEMDAQTVVMALKSSKNDESEFGSIVEDCRIILQQEPSFSIDYINRLANTIAHALAKGARSYANPCAWSSPPTHIGDLVVRDVLLSE